MGKTIDDILKMEKESEVAKAWEEISQEPKLIKEYMDELWRRIVSFQIELFAYGNAFEKFKKGVRDPSVLRSYLKAADIEIDLSDDSISNPKFTKWLTKKVADLLSDFSNLIAKCHPLITKTPLGWKCNQIGISLNFPWGAGLSVNFGPQCSQLGNKIE